ncbi:hypothetical protein ACOMHN_036639 [Nucella lapillus]
MEGLVLFAVPAVVNYLLAGLQTPTLILLTVVLGPLCILALWWPQETLRLTESLSPYSLVAQPCELLAGLLGVRDEADLTMMLRLGVLIGALLLSSPPHSPQSSVTMDVLTLMVWFWGVRYLVLCCQILVQSSVDDLLSYFLTRDRGGFRRAMLMSFTVGNTAQRLSPGCWFALLVFTACGQLGRELGALAVRHLRVNRRLKGVWRPLKDLYEVPVVVLLMAADILGSCLFFWALWVSSPGVGVQALGLAHVLLGVVGLGVYLREDRTRGILTASGLWAAR